jgi:hypothetical protein
MLGIIIFDKKLEDDISSLAEWASKPENWYDIEAFMRGEGKPPGDDKRYERIIGLVGQMRCVFSWTVFCSKKELYRHLSISVSDPKRIPSPTMSFEIARMLGFIGSYQDWGIGEGLSNPPGAHRNIVILQQIPYPEA